MVRQNAHSVVTSAHFRIKAELSLKEQEAIILVWEMNMFGTKAKDLVKALPEESRQLLENGLRRYINATSEEGTALDRAQVIADLKHHRHLLTIRYGAAYVRNDRDCIAFMVAVTGLSELHCAAYEMSELQPWHQLGIKACPVL